MTTLHLRKSIGLSQLRRGFLLMPLLLVCFGLSPTARAVVPAPDGAYPGFNTAEGGSTALAQAVPGVWNTAIGQFALNADITGGIGNTAVGLNALRANTLGDFNSALGVNALRFNVIGSNNTALGYQALFVNTGAMNTAVGVNALSHNTIGFDNSAVGQGALAGNTIGVRNSGLGFQALSTNTIGTDNTAVGWKALVSNTTIGPNTGQENTAVGSEALLSNTTGSFNTAIGGFALFNNTTGLENTAIGDSALSANIIGQENTAIGFAALVSNTGTANIALGSDAGSALTTGSFNIDIGNDGVTGDDRTIRIGIIQGGQSKTFIAGINGVNEGSPTAVFINTTTGQLGTTAPSSSRRFKKEIKPMEQTSEAILGLKPVTFHYKSDTKSTPQFGLIAEEVAEVNPDLVVRDDKGEIYTVRYEAVNAMLLNEFLKEHRTVQGQQKEIDALKAELKEQKALIQRVSDKVELNRPAPKTVLNNQ